MSLSAKKIFVANFTARTGIQWIARQCIKALTHGVVRVVNGHSVPQSSTENFREQLAYYRQHYCDVTYEDLQQLFETGVWSKSKPGLIVSFDDGLRTQAEIAAPLLEEYGFTGWFFLPHEFLDTPEDQQRDYAQQHQILLDEDLPGPRIAMTWEQARQLQERHVVGCHTASHCRLSAALTDEQRKHEIGEAKQVLEKRLGSAVDSFAWVGGQRWAYSRSCAEEIANANFRFSFMTNSLSVGAKTPPLQIDRTHVESWWPMSIVRFQLSGIVDLFFTRKRRSVHRETTVQK